MNIIDIPESKLSGRKFSEIPVLSIFKEKRHIEKQHIGAHGYAYLMKISNDKCLNLSSNRSLPFVKDPNAEVIEYEVELRIKGIK